jgi:hypothetical protein
LVGSLSVVSKSIRLTCERIGARSTPNSTAFIDGQVSPT